MKDRTLRVGHIGRIRWVLVLTGAALLMAMALSVWPVQPAISATTTSTTVVPRPALSLEAFDFTSPSTGLGVFTEETPSGSSCSDYVGKTNDSGAKFVSLVRAMSWSCGSVTFSSTLAADGHGDIFLYGPDLYVSHDNGKTWSSGTASGSVLDVDPVGLSVWMVVSACTHHETVASLPCPAHLLESTNGGRSWKLSISTPLGATNGVSDGAHGQTYLVRLSRYSAYLMLAPYPTSGSSSVAPLWFTSNGGESWSSREVHCHIGALSSVFSVAPSGALMAACASQPGAGMQPRSILESTNGGRSWTLKSSTIASGYLGAIDLISPHEAFLVGSRSSLQVTRDGGKSWRPVQPLIASTAGGTSQVTFFGGTHGLVLGNDDADNENLTLWRSADGGKHWTKELPVAAIAP